MDIEFTYFVPSQHALMTQLSSVNQFLATRGPKVLAVEGEHISFILVINMSHFWRPVSAVQAFHWVAYLDREKLQSSSTLAFWAGLCSGIAIVCEDDRISSSCFAAAAMFIVSHGSGLEPLMICGS